VPLEESCKIRCADLGSRCTVLALQAVVVERQAMVEMRKMTK
jgi:hypothetical protein